MSELKVLEAYTRDVGRGVIRIDYDTMDRLKVSTGDAVKITGKKTTVLKALPLYPNDEGKEICRIDGLTRNNCGSDVNSNVSLEKIKSDSATKVFVTPLEAIPPIDERYLTDALESIIITKGDNVMVPYFGTRITFKVIKATPNHGTVTTNTVFKIVTEHNDNCHTCGQATQDSEKLAWIKRIMDVAVNVNWGSLEEQGKFASYLGSVWDEHNE